MAFGRWRKRQSLEAQPPANAAQIVRLESVADRLFGVIQSAGSREFPELGLVGTFEGRQAKIAPKTHGANWEEFNIFRDGTGEMHIQRERHLPGTEVEHLAGSMHTTTDFTLNAGAPSMTAIEPISPLDKPALARVDVSQPIGTRTCEALRVGFQNILDVAGSVAVGSTIRTA